jgi:phage terminase small subunit
VIVGRQRSPDRDKAFAIYKEHKGNIDLVEIAKLLNLSDGTVRGWKNKDTWDCKLNGTLQKKSIKNTERSKTEKTKKKIKNKEPKHQAVTDLENAELTDKQRLFCIYYIKYFNATKAYLKAYDCDYNTAMVNGCKLLINTKVKDAIAVLKADKLKGAMLEPGDVLQRYIDIAFADISDFVVFGQEEVEVMGPFGPVVDKDGEKVTKMVNSVKFRPWTNVDGTLISEIGQGKDGAKLKLYDKMKALDWLANHMDLLDTYTKEKLEIEKQKLAIAKIKAGDGEEEEVEDDGFIEALKGEVAEVWSDEENNK